MARRKSRKSTDHFAKPHVANHELPHPGDILPPGARVRLGTNRLNHVVRAGNTGVCRIAFSADGHYLLALGYQDDEASLWEIPSGREVWRRELDCGVDRGAGVAFSPDGQFLVIGNRTLKVFDVATGQDVRTLRTGWPPTQGLAFSPCGRFLAEGRYDGRVDVWAVKGWEVVTGFNGEPEPAREGTGDDHFQSVAFSTDSNLLAAGSYYTRKRACRRRDINRLQREAEAAGDPYPRSGGLADGDEWYVAKDAGRVWVWDRVTGKVVNRLEGPSEGVNVVHFLANGTLAASAGDETVRVWDVTSGRELRSFRWGTWGSNNPFPAVFRPDGQAVAGPASGTPDATVILDTNTGAEIGRLPGSYNLAWSPDGKTLATAEVGRCHLWDLETGNDAAPPGRHFERPDVIVFSADGRRVLTAGARHCDAFVWNAVTGQLVATVPSLLATNHRTLILSPDGTRVAAYHGQLDHPRDGGPKDPHLYLWDVESGQVQEFPLDAEPQAITWVADGQAVILSDRTGLSLHSLGNSPSQVAFRRTRMIPRSLRALPNGDVVGLASDQVCVWDAEGRLSARALFPDVSEWFVFILAVSPDSRGVAVDRAGTITVWHPQPVDARGRPRSTRSRASDAIAPSPAFVVPEDFGAASDSGLGTTAEFLADGRLLVGACRGNPEVGGPFVVKVWEAATRLEVWESPMFSCGISEVVFAPGGRSMAVALDDATTLIFDMPVRPLSINQSWLTSTVVALARGIRADHALDRLPILADALQDAGCDDIDILGLCRDSRVTGVRASWVLDLLLGKE